MEEGEKKIKRSVGGFFSDAENLLVKYLPEFDSRDFVKSIQNKIQMDMDSSDLFSYDSGSDENEYGLVDYLGDLLNVIELGLPNLVCNIFTHDEDVAKIEDYINSISRDFDPTPYLELAFKSKDKIIELVKKCFITDLIEPLQEQIQEIRSKKNDKEKELHTAEARRNELADKKAVLARQMQSIAEMRHSI